MAFTGLGGGDVSLPGMGKQVLVAANTLPSSLISILLLQVRWSLTQVATPGLGMGVQGGAGSNPAPSGLLITVFLFQVQGRFSAAASPALGVGSRVFLLFTVQLRMLRHLPWV